MPDEGERDGPNLLSERVTNEIRNLILNGELAPGERIGQEMLAERFGTSRIPVREALRRTAPLIDSNSVSRSRRYAFGSAASRAVVADSVSPGRSRMRRNATCIPV
jgi:hypothetical protein